MTVAAMTAVKVQISHFATSAPIAETVAFEYSWMNARTITVDATWCALIHQAHSMFL